METQGSVWREWLADVDLLTTSPKPPSSGMVSPEHDSEIQRFLTLAVERGCQLILKVVVFDERDYTWAQTLRARWTQVPFYLSCGTDPPEADVSQVETLRGVSDRYRWLCERAVHDPAMIDARILPQLHVLAWGHEKGR